MQINTQLITILNKEMSRKDFIKHVGLGIVALSGAALALRLLSGNDTKGRDEGYSGSTYGGSEGPR